MTNLMRSLIVLGLLTPAAWADVPDPQSPVQLVVDAHDQSGKTVELAGFVLYVPPGWTLTCDAAAASIGSCESGILRPTGPTAGNESEKHAADAQIRFEPFPADTHATASLDEYVAHLRSTVAAGVPVDVAGLPIAGRQLPPADPAGGPMPGR